MENRMSAVDMLQRNNEIREANAQKRERDLTLDNQDIMANTAILKILAYILQKITNSFHKNEEEQAVKEELIKRIQVAMNDSKEKTMELINSDKFNEMLKEKMPNLKEKDLAEFKEQCKEVLHNDEAKLNVEFFLKDRDKEVQKSEKQTEHNKQRQNYNRQR